MKKYKPVAVPKAAFAFCRYSVAILVWLSWIFRIKILLVLVFIILLWSAILKVGRAPMILIYKYTINRVVKSADEILDENAMRFAHTLGSIICFICLFLIYFISEPVGWSITFMLAILKSVSALGFCPASKLYGCMTSGGCCVLTKKHD